MDPEELSAAERASAEGPRPTPGANGAHPLDEAFLHRVTPLFKLLRLYSRLEVEGLERIPAGPAILVANHTGWLGLDYAYAALAIHDARKRAVYGLTHPAWYKRPEIARIATRLGLREVSKDAMRGIVTRGDLVLMFPEGERGAFKTDKERYRLQPFAKGYVRVALETGVPVIPVAILGGEEANPTSGRIDSYEKLLELPLPVPQNLFPRPVKWRIAFLDPVRFTGGAKRADDRDAVAQLNDTIRDAIQAELERLRTLRGHPYL